MPEWSPPDHIAVEEDNLSSLEVSLPFDVHNLEVQRADYGSQTYKRIEKEERKRFQKHLSRDPKGDFDSVKDLLLKWKDPDTYHGSDAQSYELLMKEALNLPADVRNDAKKADTPDGYQKRTCRQLYVSTQCFLAVHFGTRDTQATKRVYRGIRAPSIAKLVAQVIDNPTADRYYFYTSTVANHSGLESVAVHHSDSIVIDWTVHRQKVLIAADRLFNTPSHEDEFQIVGGIIRVGAEGVIHEGTQSGRTRRLQTVIQSMNEPAKLDDIDHKDIADLVAIMEENDVPVTSKGGAERLDDWFHEVDSRELFSVKKTRTLKAQVQYLIEAGRSNG